MSNKAHIGTKRSGTKCSTEVYGAFFFIFHVCKNLRPLKVENFYEVFWKRNISKTKMKWENTLCFCRTTNSSSIDMNIDSLGRTVIPMIFIPRTPHFPVSCEKLVFYEEKREKYTTVTLVILRFYMHPQILITIGTIRKKKLFGSMVLLVN